MGAVPADAIRFGTDGWRAVIAEGFTFANVRRVTRALCDILAADGQARHLVVGFDTRFLSDEFARAAAETAASLGFRVTLTARATPTPAVSFATRERGAAAGVVITASHNPPRYNGYKLKGPFGGPAAESFTKRVERAVAPARAARGEPVEAAAEEEVAAARDAGEVTEFDAAGPYLDRVKSFVDAGALRGAGGPWIVDAMHGSGRGWLADALRELGVECVEIRGEANPSFGGFNPEPVGRNLSPLQEAVREHGARGGLALDGDGDRLGLVDEAGRIVDAQHVFALLLRHLVDVRGERGAVVKTFAVSDMIDRLAAARGVELVVRPVGFKHVTEYAIGHPLLLGGEESGGFGFGRHLPERDGILCALLLLEAVGASGATVSELVASLHEEVGPSVYGRVDLALPPARIDGLRRLLSERPPESVAGIPVVDRDTLDGCKLRLRGGGWVLFRASGTEPLVRVYAEMADEAGLRKVLAAGGSIAEGRP